MAFYGFVDMKKTFRYALKQTLPILLAFMFLGIAFGLSMKENGYGLKPTVAMAALIYSGSLQYALIPLVRVGADLFTIALISFSVSMRHIFYAISMIDRYRERGKRKLMLMFGLVDETFSLLVSDIPEEIDRQQYYFYVTVLNYIYWVAGCRAGAVFGTMITFSTKGIDFAMTRLFTVIALEQWLGSKDHTSSLTGLLCAMVFLLLVGPSRFIMPALIVSVTLLVLMRGRIEGRAQQ